ncbi:LysM domain protein [Neomoorella glycerini]|uniref:LysM domain protein n=1 Tax=Neomoorella glycerini TaxID=55779 RepID=A0A6I5ZNW9_9FIRM|nr:LysM peptidoglycan-binding domain-containing protein [Moorella glycerini]QGP91305.1 LysM domain protein [Moorella glycerini]
MFRRHKLRLVLFIFVLAAMVVFPLVTWAMSYQVQPGDTLWLIARRFGTSVDGLKSSNNLSSDIMGVEDPDQGFANIATITKMMYDYQENLARR